MHALVTGGAGYIGSHAAARLLRDGHRVTVLDDLSRGNRAAVDRLATALDPGGDRFRFVEGSITDRELLDALLREDKPDAVLHFAALAYVGESVPSRCAITGPTSPAPWAPDRRPASRRRRPGSSSAAPARPTASRRSASPWTSRPPEPGEPLRAQQAPRRAQALRDYAEACRRNGKDRSRYAALRYFNVAGSDPDGLVGEDHEPETHLIPVVIEAALGKRDSITIFGTDYDTPDGTCIRDYVHVCDLVDAHIAVMDALSPATSASTTSASATA
jgi:UDP-glucose 4-epimerase